MTTKNTKLYSNYANATKLNSRMTTQSQKRSISKIQTEEFGYAILRSDLERPLSSQKKRIMNPRELAILDVSKRKWTDIL